jgi:primosomal protein N' (replication factor Y) (superfamily II helicase)
VHAGEVDILVGTQMLAKGHDFPNLTLVGVLDTDSALYSPDFRASEKLFAQLMQVAGRAGRADKAGEVLIQTAFPQHVLFDALRSQDYESFANQQLQERVAMQYPPASFFALLRAESNKFAEVEKFLHLARNAARNLNTADLKNSVTVYDIIRPQMERLKSMERGQLLLQANSRAALQRLLKAWMPEIKGFLLANKVRWSIDIDPLEF